MTPVQDSQTSGDHEQGNGGGSEQNGGPPPERRRTRPVEAGQDTGTQPGRRVHHRQGAQEVGLARVGGRRRPALGTVPQVFLQAGLIGPGQFGAAGQQLVQVDGSPHGSAP